MLKKLIDEKDYLQNELRRIRKQESRESILLQMRRNNKDNSAAHESVLSLLNLSKQRMQIKARIEFTDKEITRLVDLIEKKGDTMNLSGRDMKVYYGLKASNCIEKKDHKEAQRFIQLERAS